MKLVTTFGIGLLLVFTLAAASGCREEGAAEKAGKAFDQAVDDLEDKAEEAKEKLE